MKPVYKIVRIIDRKKQGRLAKAQRKSVGLPLRVIAEQLGISTVYLFGLESGVENWTANRVRDFNRACKKKV